MQKKFIDIAFPKRAFATHKQILKFHGIFLKVSLSLVGVATLMLGVYFWSRAPVNSNANFGVALINIVLLIYLFRFPEKVAWVGTTTLLLWLGAACVAFLFLKYNTMRVVVFFPLVAAVFYLKNFRVGAAWVVSTVLLLLIVPDWLGLDTGYSTFQMLFTSFCLLIMFTVLWHYEALKEEQFQRENEYQLQSVMDARWRVAVESAGDAIWDWDIATDRFVVSKHYAEMLGFSVNELGDTAAILPKLLHPDDLDKSTTYLQEYLNGDFSQLYSTEVRLSNKNGGYRWILCRGRVTQRDAAGRPLRMVGTHTDISSRKLAEANLKDSDTRLHLAMASAHMGVWDMELSTGKLYWSPEVFQILGLPPFEPSMDEFFKWMNPNEVEKISHVFKKAVEAGSSFVVEFKCNMPSRQVWLEDRGEVICDEKGKPLRMVGTVMDITERKEHERQLQQIAHFDPLTGVPNRVLLADRLVQSLARTKRDKGLMAVCYLDLDGFKPINDSFGHASGDKVLVEITRRIKDVIREDDTVARLGGDEFVVLLVGMNFPEECVGSLQRLLEAIHQPLEIQGKTRRISASIGVALYPDDDQDPDTLLRHADQAMYVAKQAGKNRYHLFDAVSDLRARSHHEVLLQIRRSLTQGDFELYYQPKVKLDTWELVGAEALIRWNHPQRGLLVPSEFLSVIENTELEVELGDWVIATAINQLRRWREMGLAIEISINVSAYHLQSSDFSEKLKAQSNLCCPGNCAGTLQIEVLETAALEDVSSVSAIIKECKAFGMDFALDDFGTGYSSLSYLSKFDVDVLKIDQSFVRDMLEDKGDHAIVQGIISLAKAFEMGTVAEGVETREQYQALLEMGCEVGQGYGIASPMPAADLFVWHPKTDSRLFTQGL